MPSAPAQRQLNAGRHWVTCFLHTKGFCEKRADWCGAAIARSLEMNQLNSRLQDLAAELEHRATHDTLTGS